MPNSCTSAHCKYSRNANSGAGTIKRASIVCERTITLSAILMNDHLTKSLYMKDNFQWSATWFKSWKIFLGEVDDSSAKGFSSWSWLPWSLLTNCTSQTKSWEKLAFVEKDRVAINFWILENIFEWSMIDVMWPAIIHVGCQIWWIMTFSFQNVQQQFCQLQGC